LLTPSGIVDRPFPRFGFSSDENVWTCPDCAYADLGEERSRQMHLAMLAKGYQVKGCLAKIDTNRTNLHVDDPP
jgi:hypothetical protein